MKPTLPQKILSVNLENPTVTKIDNLSFFELPQPGQQQETLTTDTDISSENDELSYTATATLLGKEKTPLQGLIMNDTVHMAIGVFNKEQISIDEVFDGLNEIAGSYMQFKQARITIDEKSGMFLFSGFLTLDGPVLSTFKEFLKLDYMPYVEAIIDPDKQDISKKIILDNVSFATASSFYKDINPAITLSEGGLILLVEKNEETKSWQVTPIVKGVFTFNNIAKNPVRMAGEITYSKGTLQVKASTPKVENVFGIENLALDNFKASFQLGNTKSLSITADLVTPSQSYQFKGAIESDFMCLTAKVKNAFTFNDLTNIFKTKANYSAPDNKVSFENVSLTIASADGKIGAEEVKRGIQVTADITVNNHKCKANAMITKEDILFTGAITDTVSIGDVHFIKPEMELIYAGASSKKKSGLQIKGEIKYESLTLKAGLSYKKISDGWNAVVYADVANPTFSISDILPNTKNTAVDTIKFSKATFVYAQKACKIDELPDEDIKAGFQLKAMVKEFTPIQTLLRDNKNLNMKLELLLSKTNKSLHISMPEDTRLQLGEQVVCKPFKIGVLIDPTPKLSLSFPVSIKPTPQDTALDLDFTLKVGAIDASASATMLGYWKHPFGVKGIQIGPELATEIGINYVQFASTGTPSSLGIAGGLQLGDIKGKMALKGSSAGKDQILYGEVETLSPENLAKFASEITGQQIPLNSVPPFFELQQLKIYCAPLGGSIGNIIYEPGFSFVCNMVLFKKKINLQALVNSDGMQLAGHVDEFKLGPLELKGAVGKDAKVDVKLTTEQQSIFFDGRIQLCNDIMAAAYLDIKKDKAEFFFDYQFFDLLKYKVKGKSLGSLNKLEELDFELTAQFENDICQYLKTEMVKKIKEVQEHSNQSLEAIKKDLDKAQKEYETEFQRRKKLKDNAEKDAEALKKTLTEALQNAQATLKKESAKAEQNLADAKAAYDKVLTDANTILQSTKATYDKAWVDANNVLNEARRVYYAALNDAENTLKSAKASYDSKSDYLRNKLNAAQQDVDGIDNEIRHYQNLRNSYGVLNPKRHFNNAQIAACDVKKVAANAALGAARTALNLLDKTTEAATYFAANTAFEAARTGFNQGVLRKAEIAYQELEKGVSSFEPYKKAEAALEAIKSGNQRQLWQAAEDSYKMALQVGQLAVKKATEELNQIELTEVVKAFREASAFLAEIEKSVLSVNVSVAQAALSMAQSGVNVTAAVSTFVAKNAGAVINIKKADLYVKLSELKQGKGFRCSMLLDAFGKENIQWDLILDVDVEAAKKFTMSMYDNLMKEAEKVLPV